MKKSIEQYLKEWRAILEEKMHESGYFVVGLDDQSDLQYVNDALAVLRKESKHPIQVNDRHLLYVCVPNMQQIKANSTAKDIVEMYENGLSKAYIVIKSDYSNSHQIAIRSYDEVYGKWSMAHDGRWLIKFALDL